MYVYVEDIQSQERKASIVSAYLPRPCPSGTDGTTSTGSGAGLGGRRLG